MTCVRVPPLSGVCVMCCQLMRTKQENMVWLSTGRGLIIVVSRKGGNNFLGGSMVGDLVSDQGIYSDMCVFITY